MYGDYNYDNIDFVAAANALMFICNYNDVTIGSGVKCTKSDASYTDMLFLAGVNVGIGGSPESEITLYDECNITVSGGTWSYIRCGNRRALPSYAHGGIAETGKLTVTINGGLFTANSGTNLSCASGMNNTKGECTLIINGGEFRGNLYVVGRAGTNSTGKGVVMSGKVNLIVNGGTFGGKIIAVQDNTVKVTGSVNVTCASAYESKLQGNFTSKVIK
jgi:hypothetical protein